MDQVYCSNKSSRVLCVYACRRNIYIVITTTYVCLSVCLCVCNVEDVAGALFTGSLTTNAVDGILSTCNSTISAFFHLTIQLQVIAIDTHRHYDTQ